MCQAQSNFLRRLTWLSNEEAAWKKGLGLWGCGAAGTTVLACGPPQPSAGKTWGFFQADVHGTRGHSPHLQWGPLAHGQTDREEIC